jgi:hypothetical protein
MSWARSKKKVVKVGAWLVGLALVDGAMIGCQSTGETTGGAVCTFAERVDCIGTDGCFGSTVCLPDLSGYGDCDCGRDAGVSDAALSDAAVTDGATHRDAAGTGSE